MIGLFENAHNYQYSIVLYTFVVRLNLGKNAPL